MPTQSEITLAKRLEPAVFAAWPAREVVAIGGWRLRFSRGFSARANSAATFEAPNLLIGAAIADAAEAYRTRGLKPLIHHSPASEPEGLAEILTARGWRDFKPTLVMTAPAGVFAEAAAPATVEVSPQISDAWRAGFASGSAKSDDSRERLDTIARISQPTAFAAIVNGGETEGVGLSVFQGEFASVFCMRTIPAARRRGHARAIVGALGAWAKAQGATTIYLQVEEENTPARSLYQQAGFARAYSYRFFAPE